MQLLKILKDKNGEHKREDHSILSMPRRIPYLFLSCVDDVASVSLSFQIKGLFANFATRNSRVLRCDVTDMSLFEIGHVKVDGRIFTSYMIKA